MKRIKFEEMPFEVPVIKFLFGDRRFYALVDSGSETTLLDKTFAKKEKIKIKINTKKVECIGLSNSQESVFIETTLDANFISTDNTMITEHIKALCADLSMVNDHLVDTYKLDSPVVAIIGSDFLTQRSAKLNFKTKTMTLQ